jgi:GrpB-like predicted nucleotidyltransferase (UPF0157 family)
VALPQIWKSGLLVIQIFLNRRHKQTMTEKMNVSSGVADKEDVTLIFRDFLRQNVAVPVAAMNALVSKIKVRYLITSFIYVY